MATHDGETSTPPAQGKEAKGCLPVLLAVIMLASFWLLGETAGGDDEDRVTARSGAAATATGSPSPSLQAMPSLTPAASPRASAAVTASPEVQPQPPKPSPAETDPVVLCDSRPPASAEIYVRYVTTDEPPTAIRLGGNWTWDFGVQECITSTEMALRSTPPLSGFCTQVALVTDNPGFDPDVRPAPRLRRVVGERGDC